MDTHHIKNQNLSSMFYYDISQVRNKNLKKGLQEYRFLLSVLKSALIHFKNKDFEKFDSLVGENACQIRAIKIAVMASQNQINVSDLIQKLESSINKIEKLTSIREISKLMLSGITLKDLLKRDEIDICLSSHEMFAFQSFLLTETKEPQPNIIKTIHLSEKSAPKNLKKFCNEVSSNFMDCICSRARRLLAEASVRYIRELAWNLNDLNLIRMVSNEFLEEHNTWPCIPMYWTYKTILLSARKQNIPIILHAKFLEKSDKNYTQIGEEKLFFKSHKENISDQYIQMEPDEADLTKPAFVVQGIVCIDSSQDFCAKKWKENLLNYPIFDVILAGAADHRQYPNPSISIQIDDPDYEKYRTMAKMDGFSIENPTTFFINHVYSQKVEKIFSIFNNNLELSANC
jgi:hypothetical protein